MVVFTSYVKVRQAGTPNSGTVLSIQAQKLHSDPNDNNPNDFVASKCWNYSGEH